MGVVPVSRYNRGQAGLHIGSTRVRVAVTAAWGLCRFLCQKWHLSEA